MTNLEEKIKKIEEEIRKTPYHKGTEHHLGRLKARLAYLKEKLSEPKKSGGGGFALKKEGDATCVLIGFPSVGKSTLLNKLTTATSKVADYEFTTLNIIPGVLKYRGANIQILDLPGIISGASQNKGGGKKILASVRTADLLLVLIDALKPKQEIFIKKELYQAGVRINQRKPAIKIKKTNRGGLQLSLPHSFSLNEETVRSIAREFGLVNAQIIIKENLSLEQLIDGFSFNRVYLPALFIVNKIDLIANRQQLKEKFSHHLFISAKKNIGLKNLKEAIWQKLNLIRIYLKPKTGKIDYQNPIILKKGATVLQAAAKVSQELAKNLKAARLYGSGVCFEGQKVGADYPLRDGLIITFLS